MLYGQWINYSRLVNYQELLPVYLNNLKYFAYSLQDKYLGAKAVERVVNADNNPGYRIKVANISEVIEDLLFRTFYEREVTCGKFADDGEAKITLEKCTPGTIVIVAGDLIIVDDKEGNLVGVDKSREYNGTVDYSTGAIVINDAVLNGLDYVVSYGKTTTKTIAEYTPEFPEDGVTYYKAENVCNPFGGSLYGLTISMNDTDNEFYLGITTAIQDATA